MTVAMEGNSEWNQWLEPYLFPLGASFVGDDPRYSEAFSSLKAEVEKRQDINFHLIESLSLQVLTENAKDLRAAGYYVLAASRLHGLDGFYKGLVLFHGLLEKFGDQCHPQKSKARQAALRWPLQSRVLTFVQAHTKNAGNDLYEATLAAFDSLCNLVKPEISDYGWPDLRKWLSQNIAVKPAEKDPEPQQKTSEPLTIVGGNADQAASDMTVSSIQSETQLLQISKQLLGYYREKKQYGVMAGLSRSMKWGDLKLPPNESGKTRIPAPRESSLNKVKVAFENEEWTAAFFSAEDAFLEPGGIFCFELQRLSALAARKAGYNSAAKIIEDNFLSLLSRLPKIKQLTYENGDPFLAGSVIAWIEQIMPAEGGSQVYDPTMEFLAEARKIKEEKNLTDALKWLKSQGGSSEVTAQKICLIQAQLCHESGEAAKAFPILDRLDIYVQEHRLERFMPEFAMSVWRQKWLVMKDLKAQVDVEQQSAYEADISRLQSLMCATDVSLAIEWL
ncbi:TssA family type VI secretion system protein [Gynuella sp.]|uniref:TssA family type VI secretion system protein n=1 Tax=Gynuella sp. TaxID=2969146 RepID=UPI003D14266F